MKKEFQLKSFKLEKFGVSCKYRITEIDDDGVTTENDYNVKVSRPVHRDIELIFGSKLTDIVADILGRPKVAGEGMSEDLYIQPNAVAMSGSDDGAGIVISGTIRTFYGDVAFRTPRIKYRALDWDVCGPLTVLVDELTDEAYAYLFENKGEEMEVFGE